MADPISPRYLGEDLEQQMLISARSEETSNQDVDDPQRTVATTAPEFSWVPSRFDSTSSYI